MTTTAQRSPARPRLVRVVAAALMASPLLLAACSSGGGAGEVPSSAPATTATTHTASPTVPDDLSPERPRTMPREVPADDVSASSGLTGGG
ncbi:hypothetical protein [Cellulomonas sp. P24]|uniref:hypothetical protein n=1 Tax=Cellulomonas sp. P24 TaxID=2885206 RepID=UPI00216B4F94|nr:hypothetical protein [Cellulomonas sp. P24]MCR6492908.1 hypothetical protein [Cellulomonas sp. P24]